MQRIAVFVCCASSRRGLPCCSGVQRRRLQPATAADRPRRPTLTPVGDRRCSRRRPYDPRWWRQFDDPVLDAARDRGARRQPRRPHRRGPRRAGARGLRRRAPRSLSDGDGRRRRGGPRAGHAGLHRRADPHRRLSRRLRRVLGARPVRPRPLAGARGARPTPRASSAALDDVRVSVAAEVARNYFELRGLQQQLAVLERSLANQRETLRLTEVRRDAGIGEEQDVASAAARVAAIEAGVPPLRAGAGGSRASTRGARPARGRAQLASIWRRAPIRRWPRRCALGDAGDAAAPAARRARGRAAAGRRRGPAGRGRRRPVSAHHRVGRARAAGRARQPVRQRRLARLGGDAGAAAGRPSTSAARVRGCAAPRPARARRWRTTSRPCCSRSRRPRTRSSAYREQQQRLVQAGRPGAREHARRRHRPRALSRGRRRLPVAARRRAHGAAGRGRRRAGRSGRVHGVVAVYKSLGGL